MVFSSSLISLFVSSLAFCLCLCFTDIFADWLDYENHPEISTMDWLDNAFDAVYSFVCQAWFESRPIGLRDEGVNILQHLFLIFLFYAMSSSAKCNPECSRTFLFGKYRSRICFYSNADRMVSLLFADSD
jgi:hypothetical protein